MKEIHMTLFASGPDCFTIFAIVMVAMVWTMISWARAAAKVAGPAAKVAAKAGFHWWLTH
jgi:hypothetical protein